MRTLQEHDTLQNFIGIVPAFSSKNWVRVVQFTGITNPQVVVMNFMGWSSENLLAKVWKYPDTNTSAIFESKIPLCVIYRFYLETCAGFTTKGCRFCPYKLLANLPPKPTFFGPFERQQSKPSLLFSDGTVGLGCWVASRVAQRNRYK